MKETVTTPEIRENFIPLDYTYIHIARTYVRTYYTDIHHTVQCMYVSL